MGFLQALPFTVALAPAAEAADRVLDGGSKTAYTLGDGDHHLLLRFFLYGKGRRWTKEEVSAIAKNAPLIVWPDDVCRELEDGFDAAARGGRVPTNWREARCFERCGFDEGLAVIWFRVSIEWGSPA